LQPDHDPTHRGAAKVVRPWASGHGQQVSVLDNWPPNSPDLNLVENVWSCLRACVDARARRVRDSFKQALQEEWEAVAMSMLANLYASMPNRLAKVTSLGGKKAKYSWSAWEAWEMALETQYCAKSGCHLWKLDCELGRQAFRGQPTGAWGLGPCGAACGVVACECSSALLCGGFCCGWRAAPRPPRGPESRLLPWHLKCHHCASVNPCYCGVVAPVCGFVREVAAFD